MKYPSKLTASLATDLLDYRKDTGEIYWRLRDPGMFRDGKWTAEHACAAWNSRYAGKIAGKVDSRNGYRYIAVFGRSYAAHRIAWLIVTGKWPRCEIDHINGVTSDNSFANLREATRGENARNLPLPTTNNSGIIGVHFDRRLGKWRACIGAHGTYHHLGVFTEKQDAARARKAAEEQYGFHANHGGRSRPWQEISHG